ncbi:UAA transporter family [Seminavis robusta]|uniref:UAA transporter family n=1 Tax=Seminavis robusta TaxID=568900 RepID=A0A9N8HJ58_9STRA|nr:UAA transporter family [Seminavis robusta]|eukprot:Sro638_g179560.1 UAA transporter family (432) ;mRNA; f:16751-18046
MASSSSSSLALPAMMASVVVSAVANTIIRRIALVPMQKFPYFLTQLQTLTYVFFYSSMLYLRFREGTVTWQMMQIRKSPFLYIGLWDSLGDMLGNVGTSQLPGYQVPLLAKLNIVFTAVFSALLLGKRYSGPQIAAMTVVLCGSVVTLIPTIFASSTAGSTSESTSSFSDLFYAGVYVASVAPTALAFVLKEQVFRENQHLNLDIFVVNTFGSIVGLVFTIALLPLAAVPGLGKIQLHELPSYMKHGAACFAGHSPVEDYDCTGAPLAPLLYFAINLTYNICFLNLIKHGGALLTFITNTVTFPLSTILFTLSWPLLGSSTLNSYIIFGLCVELTGVVLYQRASSAVVKQQKEVDNPQEPIPAGDVSSLLGRSNQGNYGSVVECGEESANDYLEAEPPLCYNRCLRESIGSSCCNKEELCKCLLSPKCNCG